jgi:transcriptional regulator of nitric oxide reductase
MKGKRPAQIDDLPAFHAMYCIGEGFSWSEFVRVGIYDRETGRRWTVSHRFASADDRRLPIIGAQ